ncbi:PIN domain-containing protein [Opitutaceae bacterium]|nr:PIN domain-containing protein [Opitutaceae bacterium]
MKIIVDTDVWSEAFRKKGNKSPFVGELRQLIHETRVQMTGTIRMEILCGIRDPNTFQNLRKSLAAFPDRELDTDVFETAAKFFNLCRSKGIQGSNNDFIICACSVRWKMPILTKDRDFTRYAKILPIDLVKPRVTKA